MALSKQDLINKVNLDLATNTTITAVEHRGVLQEVINYAESKVENQLRNGQTLSAPSEDVVFDALATKENTANKSTDTNLGTSNTLFPTQNAAKVYADNKVTNLLRNGQTTTAPSEDVVFDALATKEGTIAAGNTGQYWRGDKTFQTLNSAAVGLGNVNNTSDINKPVSTAQQAAIDAVRNSSAFIGEIRMIAVDINAYFNSNGVGTVAPYIGWAICNGSSNGTVDMRGRVPVGISNTESEFNTLGQPGGSKDHMLTTAQIPEHWHYTFSPPSNTPPPAGTFVGINVNQNSWPMQSSDGSGWGDEVYRIRASNAQATLGRTSYVGGSNGNTVPHNNLQPYRVLVFIQKIY